MPRSAKIRKMRKIFLVLVLLFCINIAFAMESDNFSVEKASLDLSSASGESTSFSMPTSLAIYSQPTTDTASSENFSVDSVGPEIETNNAEPPPPPKKKTPGSSTSSKTLPIITGICEEGWQCTDWEECMPDGMKRRTCTDNNTCGAPEHKPNETMACLYQADTEDKKNNMTGTSMPTGQITRGIEEKKNMGQDSEFIPVDNDIISKVLRVISDISDGTIEFSTQSLLAYTVITLMSVLVIVTTLRTVVVTKKKVPHHNEIWRLLREVNPDKPEMKTILKRLGWDEKIIMIVSNEPDNVRFVISEVEEIIFTYLKEYTKVFSNVISKLEDPKLNIDQVEKILVESGLSEELKRLITEPEKDLSQLTKKMMFRLIREALTKMKLILSEKIVYIQSLQAKGFDDFKIKNALTKAGWKEQMVSIFLSEPDNMRIVIENIDRLVFRFSSLKKLQLKMNHDRLLLKNLVQEIKKIEDYSNESQEQYLLQQGYDRSLVRMIYDEEYDKTKSLDSQLEMFWIKFNLLFTRLYESYYKQLK